MAGVHSVSRLPPERAGIESPTPSPPIYSGGAEKGGIVSIPQTQGKTKGPLYSRLWLEKKPIPPAIVFVASPNPIRCRRADLCHDIPEKIAKVATRVP